MSAALVQVARQFYPEGFPEEDDDLSQPVPAWELTPEHERFMAAWEKALHWDEWKTLMKRLHTVFPGYGVGGGTQPFVSACLRCFVYRAEPLPDDGQFVTRVAAAVSVLAPVYIVYVTTQVWHSAVTSQPPFRLRRSSRPELTFDPPPHLRPQSEALARCIEKELGCRPFPLSLAQVTLPDLRVAHLNGEPPATLLTALFSEDLANLP